MQIFTSIGLEYFVPKFLSPSMGPYQDSNLSVAALVTEFNYSLEDILLMCPCKLKLTENGILLC